MPYKDIEKGKNYLKIYNSTNNLKISNQKKLHKSKYPWVYHLRDAKNRCNNPNVIRYPHYGGRGIKFYLTNEEGEYLWKRDKAHLLKCPSINRKENDGDYTVDNCEFIEKGLNSAERNVRVSSKPVLQYDMSMNFIKEWSSMMEVQRTLGVNVGCIWCVCNQKRNAKTAGGFIWRYKL